MSNANIFISTTDFETGNYTIVNMQHVKNIIQDPQSQLQGTLWTYADGSKPLRSRDTLIMVSNKLGMPFGDRNATVDTQTIENTHSHDSN